MLIASALPLLLAASPTPGPGIDWKRTPEQIASTCKAELARARAGVKRVLSNEGYRGRALSPLERLVAVETAVAELNEALGPISKLGGSEDPKVRDAAEACTELRSPFSVELEADPALYAVATAARAAAKSPADRMLAQRYAESGRHGGAALDPRARAELVDLLDRMHAEESAFVRALQEDQARTAIEVSDEEAASLPPSFARGLKKPASGKGLLVPVGLATNELVLKNLKPTAARERFQRAFFRIGGQANVDRLQRILELRRKAALRLGYKSWSEYRLDVTSAGSPERALAHVRDLDAVLLPRARTEVAALAKLKAAAGEPGPFATFDYPFYLARAEQASFAVDAEAVRQYFPVDVVVPQVLGVFEQLLGLRFESVQPPSAWAAGVSQYAMRDAGSGRLLGWFYLDLQPREGKLTRPAFNAIRLGRALPGGGRVLPVTAISGNGPSSSTGERTLFTHQGVLEMFHEMGHLVHAMLSTAPYASLAGVNGRADFVEAPSQLFETWAWDPAILRRVSGHARTGEPLPPELAAKMAGLKRASAGAFWTRQASMAAWDLEINGAGAAEVKDTSAHWWDLWSRMTALPPLTGTMPGASFLGEAGGYDSTYYGYLWSRVWAQDMASAFLREGLTSAETGLRYRRTVLEPGATAEPEALLQAFLGRPPGPGAFYEDLGISPPKER